MPGAAYTEARRLIDIRNTRRKVLVQLELWGACPLYYYIKNGAPWHAFSGDQEEIPLSVGLPQEGVWIDEGDTMPAGGETPRVMGYAENKYAAIGIRSDEFVAMKFDGSPERYFDEAELADKAAAMGMKKQIINGMWNGMGGKQPTGIATAIQKAAPSAQSGTVTGIDKAAKSWWRNKYYQQTASSGTIAIGSRIPEIIHTLRNIIGQCTNGAEGPSIVVTTKEIFQIIKRAFDEMSQPTYAVSSVRDAEMGFESIMIDGHTIIWDVFCPADSIYCLKYDNNSMLKRQTNQTKHKVQWDSIIEDVGKHSKMDLNAGFGIIQNKNIIDRVTSQRFAARSMIGHQWLMSSFNIAWTGLSLQGVAGSNTGTLLSTW